MSNSVRCQLHPKANHKACSNIAFNKTPTLKVNPNTYN